MDNYKNKDYINVFSENGTLFSSKDELVGLINCSFLDEKDINKRPLSKLTRDISKQIGFI